MLIFLNMACSVISQYISLINLLQVKLKKKDKLVILLLYTISIILYLWIQKLSIFTMILLLSLFFIIKKIKPLQSICMTFLSCILNFSISSILSFLFGAAGISNNDVFQNYHTAIAYVAIGLFVVYKSSDWIGNMLHRMIRRIYFPPRMWILLLINIVLMFLVFVFNIIIGEYMNYSRKVIIFNNMLFGLFLVPSVISIMILFRSQMKEMENRSKQESFRNLQDYTAKVEKMYADLRVFKHDYINIMVSMKGYMEAGDMEKLRAFFSENIEPMGKKIMQNSSQLNQLMNIESVEVKSLLSSKVIYAAEIGIEVNLEVMEPVEFRGIDRIHLLVILGIFLDNAIEAACETQQPMIGISIIRNNSSVAVIIKNRYKVHEGLPYHSLGSKEISSKGENRGIGLYNVKQILSEYPNVVLETSYNQQFFEQHLEITE